jgi:DNA-binding NtrC family response regulator
MGNKILLADDEENTLWVMSDLLTHMEYQVEAKNDGDDALSALLLDPPGFDVVISDHFMRKMSGLTLAERILKIRPDIPIIIVSGAEDQIRSQAEAVGIRWFIQKAVTVERLMVTVRQAVSGCS